MKMYSHPIKIRQAQLQDTEAIAEIKVIGWQRAYRGIIDDEYLDAMSVSQQIDVIKKYPSESVFVAEEDHEIVGFCRFYDYDKPVYEDEEIDCEIREIYVKPDRKRMGIGSALFNHTLTYFKQKGKKKLYLGCFKENLNARKFYEKMGGISADGQDMQVGGKCYPTVSYVYRLNEIST